MNLVFPSIGTLYVVSAGQNTIITDLKELFSYSREAHLTDFPAEKLEFPKMCL